MSTVNPQNASYKRYNGEEWIEYHFTTNAGQVSTTASRKFLTTSVTINSNIAGTSGAKVTVGSNDAANIEIDGAHITGSASAVSGSSLQYISASDTIAAALGKLDKAAKDAYAHAPDNVLTSDNYGETLGNVYQPLDADLTAIAALTGSGLLKKGANGWYLDTNTYITGVTINGTTGTLFNLNGSTLKAYSSGDTTISQALGSLSNAFESFEYGITQSYAIDNTESDGYNSQFTSTNDDIELTLTESQFNNNGIVTLEDDTILFKDLHVGDSVFVKQTNVPDRWVSSIGHAANAYFVTFSKLESYNMAWGAISGKPTLSISNGTITIGSNSITPLTSHQDITGKAPNNHASADSTYGLGTSSVYGHVKLVSGDLNGKSTADGMAASQSHTHSQYLTSHQSLSGYATETWVSTNFQKKITVGATEPSNKAAGDIWIVTA